jgi:hypothetical protein
MSTTETGPVAPEVRLFLARVRHELADLDPEEVGEMTDGLEADLTELVAERGASALGGPADYAAELRTAAGLEARPLPLRRRPVYAGVRDAVARALDAGRAGWFRVLDALPGRPRGFLEALQPAWWVARAWIAWMVAQDLRGPYVVYDALWVAVLAVFVIGSVQLGRRRWGAVRLLPGSVPARLGLVALNLIAVAALPGAVDRTGWHFAEERAPMLYGDAWNDEPSAVNPHVITYEGRQACVLEVRDAQGRPVPGAYVWDATGRRTLPMSTDAC